MKSPWSAGKLLSAKDWKEYRKRVLLDCRDCDIQRENYFNLARFPLLMEPEEWQTLTTLSEKLTKEALALERELILRTDLHEKLGLPAEIRKALQKCAGQCRPEGAARLMRFDFHFTPEGWRITEVNADVMGGLIEGGSFTELMAPYYPNFWLRPIPQPHTRKRS